MNAFQKTLLSIRKSSAEFARIALGVHLEDYMIEIFDAIDKYDKVLIFTCHAIGKTHGLSCYVPAQVIPFPGTKVICTAPTATQVELGLFNEISAKIDRLPKFLQYGKLTRKNNQPYWDIDKETWALGLSVQKDANPEGGQGKNSRLQGYHALDKVIALVDEGVGVDPQIWTMIDGNLTTQGDKLVGIANPTSVNCEMYERSKLRSYKVIFVSCFDTPNFKANGITCLEDLQKEEEYLRTLDQDEYLHALKNKYKIVRRHLIHVAWALEKLREWGADHPSFISKVLGQFPPDDGYALMALAKVEAAMERNNEIEEGCEISIGVDVARRGDDSTVFATIEGDKQTGYEIYKKQDTVEVLIHLINYIRRHDRYGQVNIRIAIDAGFSHGVIDDIIHWLLPQGHKKKISLESIPDSTAWEQRNIEILEVPFGGSDWVRWHFGWVDEAEYRYKDIEEHRELQTDKARYTNYKSKMFDLLATEVRNSLELLPKECYKKELPSILLKDSGRQGKYYIESKDEYKKRTGKGSPDSSDALALAVVAKTYNRQPKSPLDYYA